MARVIAVANQKGGVGKTRKVETFELPHDAGERSILLIDKEKNTPNKYPRQAGTPNKKPL